MKKLLLIAPALLLAACSVETPPEPEVTYAAEQTDDGPLARRETGLVKYVATVADVDKQKREITLKDPDGDLATFDVSPAVKRLDEVEKGDRIVAEYYESLAFEVRPPTPEEMRNPRVTVSAAENTTDDLPPGMAAGKVTRTIVMVTGVDPVQGTVTIKAPDGEMMTVKARVPENLTRVKVGDTVAVTYSRAMAIALEPYS